MKFCTTCKYFSKHDYCWYYSYSESVTNPVTGIQRYVTKGRQSAMAMRSDENKCGLDRKFYKQSLSSKIYPYFKWFLIIGCLSIFRAFYLC